MHLNNKLCVQVKCECYWPENKAEVLNLGSNLTVSLTSSIPFSEFIIRKLSVQCVSKIISMSLLHNYFSCNSIDIS